MRETILSSSYTPLIGNSDENESDYYFHGWISKLIRRGRKFWFAVGIGILFFGVLFFLVIPSLSSNETVSLLQLDLADDSQSIGSQRAEDVRRLYQQKWPIPDTNDKVHVSMDVIVNGSLIKEAVEAAAKAHDRRVQQEQKMFQEGYTLNSNSPQEKHQQLFKDHSPQSKKLAVDGYSVDQASRFVVQKLNLSAEQTKQCMFKSKPDKNSENSTLPCMEPLNPATACSWNSKNVYRTVDGLCNNLNNPQWGTANQPYRRIIPPDYSDGISAPRRAADGGPLPHPRKISTIINFDRKRDDAVASLMLPAFGQFISHDVSAIVLGEGVKMRVSCCKDDRPKPDAHPECFIMDSSIEIETTTEGAKCQSLWRSAPFPSCEFGPRKQFSQTTAFLDGSVLYGASPEAFSKLREARTPNSTLHGYMATSLSTDKRILPPISTSLLDGCNTIEETEQGRYCFISGDPRINENMALTAVHLLWIRQHNRLADQLASLSSTFSDPNKLYMEAREILVAQLQHVVYNEYLPVLLGPQLVKAAGLTLVKDGYYTKYDEKVNPMIANAFAAAAYRVGHSMMKGQIDLLDGDSKVIESVQLRQLVIDPFRMWFDGYFDGILRGYAFSSASQVDTYFTTEFSRHLFENRNGTTVGLDLPSLNIQRGRDHGIPGYTAWRNACNLQPIDSFADLFGIWDEDTIYLTRALYTSIHDIDAYTGILAELHLPGAMVGPLAGCILADQFLRLRQGDRFWYENQNRPRPFSPEQLKSIRRTTMARIICDNGDDIHKIQKRPFERVTEINQIISCNDYENIPKVDLKSWTNMLKSK